jgi:hypothetical protein
MVHGDLTPECAAPDDRCAGRACIDLMCQSQSTTIQAVAVMNQVAWWYWRVTAAMPGDALISLKVDTYLGFSTQVLKEEIILVNVNVRASQSHQPSSSATAASSPSSAPAANQGTNSGGPPTSVWALVTIGAAFITVAGGVAVALISNRGSSNKGGSSKGSGSGSAA